MQESYNERKLQSQEERQRKNEQITVNKAKLEAKMKRHKETEEFYDELMKLQLE